MELGMIGLGRMGGGMTQRLVRAGHRVVAYDTSPEALANASGEGAVGVSSLGELMARLAPPRAVWVMVPAGAPTDSTIDALAQLLSPGDTVINGGNSFYKEDMRHAEALKVRRLSFLDVGTSGGIWGAQGGYSLMVGGDRDVFHRLEPLFQALAPGPDRGYGYVGPAGAGHFVKMVHNGVEYALMQSYAEGFELLKAKSDFPLDVAQIAQIWRHGSVVRSFLLDLTAEALRQDPDLADIQGYVEDLGEGRWMVAEAVDLAVPTPVIALSLMARFRSRQENPFGARLLAALRELFGGHQVRRIP